jgi:hypothetical protein
MLKTFDTFDISENEIRAKYTSVVTVDLNEYGDDLIDTANKLVIPGIIDVYVPEFDDHAHIVLDYNINLLKNNETVTDDGKLVFTYDKGELMIEQKFKNDRDIMRTTISLMQGRTKYIKNPNTLLTLMHNVLTDSDSVHLELIIANMFRDPETGKPARFTGKYAKAEVLGQIEQGKKNSWFSSISYREIDKAIGFGLTTGQETQQNPIESILNEDFDELEESGKK